MIITIGLKKKVHEMEREHCQIEHRKSKSCPTARQIKFDSVRYLPTPELSGYGCTRASEIFMESPIIGMVENQEPKIPFLATLVGPMFLRHWYQLLTTNIKCHSVILYLSWVLWQMFYSNLIIVHDASWRKILFLIRLRSF